MLKRIFKLKPYISKNSNQNLTVGYLIGASNNFFPNYYNIFKEVWF